MKKIRRFYKSGSGPTPSASSMMRLYIINVVSALFYPDIRKLHANLGFLFFFSGMEMRIDNCRLCISNYPRYLFQGCLTESFHTFELFHEGA